MTQYIKSKKPNLKNRNKRRQPRNNGLLTQEVGDSRRLPPRTSVQDNRLLYNPTWNPQCLKVARTFQYSAPATDFGAGFGKVQDPAVGPSLTLLNYNSGALSFAISDIYNVSEYGVLFDQYKLAMVELKFDYIAGTDTVVPTTTGYSQQCTLMLYEDNDDSTAPTLSNVGWQAVYESGRAIRKVFPCPSNSIVYRLTPKFLQADVDTSSTTTGRSLTTGWCDGSTGLDIKHFGLKWIAQCNPSPTTMNHNWRITATYYTMWRSRQ
jgi:hypothetical protein